MSRTGISEQGQWIIITINVLMFFVRHLPIRLQCSIDSTLQHLQISGRYKSVRLARPSFIPGQALRTRFKALSYKIWLKVMFLDNLK